MEEARRFVRLQWPVVIKYKTIEEPLTQDQIVGKNISEGGACFVAYERLVKGTGLSMQIEVPFDSMPIFLKAEVAWVRKIGEEYAKTYEVGVVFKEINADDQKRLKMYIQNEIKNRTT